MTEKEKKFLSDISNSIELNENKKFMNPHGLCHTDRNIAQ